MTHLCRLKFKPREHKIWIVCIFINPVFDTWSKRMDRYQASASPDDGSIIWNQESWSILNMQGRAPRGPGLRKSATLNTRVKQEALYLQPRGISRIWCYLEETKGHTSGNSSGSLADLWCDGGSYRPDRHTETFDYRPNTHCDNHLRRAGGFCYILLHFRIFLLLEMMIKTA